MVSKYGLCEMHAAKQDKNNGIRFYEKLMGNDPSKNVRESCENMISILKTRKLAHLSEKITNEKKQEKTSDDISGSSKETEKGIATNQQDEYADIPF